MNFYDYEAEDAGFEILDFPCNQFGNQAPGTTERPANKTTITLLLTAETLFRSSI